MSNHCAVEILLCTFLRYVRNHSNETSASRSTCVYCHKRTIPCIMDRRLEFTNSCGRNGYGKNSRKSTFAIHVFTYPRFYFSSRYPRKKSCYTNLLSYARVFHHFGSRVYKLKPVLVYRSENLWTYVSSFTRFQYTRRLAGTQPQLTTSHLY